MIGLDYSIPFLDLDDIVDTESFLKLDKEIAMGLAKSYLHICDPGPRVYKLQNDLIYPYEEEYKHKKEVEGLTTYERRTFLKYWKDIHYSVSGVFLKKHKGYLNKDSGEGAEWTNNAKFFPELIKYINTLPFINFGRVFFFTLDHFSILTEHRDGMYDGERNDVCEFLWFTIDKNKMRFHLVDEQENGIKVKHYPESTCTWFNDQDRHTSDGIPQASYCLRIDGVFTNEFREKIKCKLSSLQT
tara:strand:- start:13818 stop:14546 length:729 start_codon:yes stop_codon:yes gene_type:complete